MEDINPTPSLAEAITSTTDFGLFQQLLGRLITPDRAEILGENSLGKVTKALLYTAPFAPDGDFDRDAYVFVACSDYETNESLPDQEIDTLIDIAKEAGVLELDTQDPNRFRIKNPALHQHFERILEETPQSLTTFKF